MFSKCSVWAVVLAAVVSLSASPALAQHGGGGGHGGGMGGRGGSHPSGTEQGDDLKDFHRALALQASDDQAGEYRALLKSLDAAGLALQSLLQPALQPAKNSTPEFVKLDAAVDENLESLHGGTKEFLDSFSRPQKSGLKDILKKLGNAESEIAKHAKALNQEAAKGDAGQIASTGESLNKALTSFRVELTNLGKEMSIAAPTGEQEMTFDLPPAQHPVTVESLAVAIGASGKISKVSSDGTQNVLQLEMVADLSDLQQKITGLMERALNKFDRCGERIVIRRATLTPEAAASLLSAELHFELWGCQTELGKEEAREVVESDATFVLKMTAAVAKDGTLRLTPAIDSVEANGAVAEMMRSGALGESMRDKMTAVLQSVVQQGLDVKTTLPASAQGATTLKSAKFDISGVDDLKMIVNGEIRMTDEQTKLLASQLKERASAK